MLCLRNVLYTFYHTVANDCCQNFLTDSHSLWFLVTYIEGETQFPAFSVVYMLDDITVGYYNSETKTCVPRGNTTNEDEEVDLIGYYLNEYYPPIVEKFIGLFKNKTKGEYNRYSTCRQKLLKISVSRVRPGVCDSLFCFPPHTEKGNRNV